jgi:DNA-binding NarL/FixJ family response regulator
MAHDLRILVVGGSGRRAESLRVILRAMHGVQSVGHAESLTAISRMLAEYKPNLVLMDMSLCEPECRAMLEQLATERPEIGWLALVTTTEQARAAQDAGAAVVLMPPVTLNRLQAAIQATTHATATPAIAPY